MFLISRFHKKCRIAYLRVSLIAIAIAAFFLPPFEPVRSVGYNIFTLFVNDIEIGSVDDSDQADRLLSEARRRVVGEANDIVLIGAESRLEGHEVLRGKTDDEEDMIQKIVTVFGDSVQETMKRSYTVKIDGYMVNVSSADDVIKLLEASIRKYVDDDSFSVSLASNPARELPSYVPEIVQNDTFEGEEEHYASDYLDESGFFAAFNEVVDNAEPAVEENLDDFKDVNDIVNVSFVNNVEVISAYLPGSQVTPLDAAIDDVTKDKEQKTIYEVVSGDTLSGIANKTGISIDEIIELNENITSARSIIRVGDEITITVPQPELSVRYEEIKYSEGSYEAPVIYQYNDNWYTTQTKTLQDPSSGYRKAVKKTVYENNNVISTEVIKEEIVVEAIPKIVEKGTKIPPTYIKPISGGRITSRFGSRTATIKGMTSYHGAVDWGVPIGTSVVASCGGTVTYAGWMASYGNVIFINHPDGRQTRYAHLSRVLVSNGAHVSQGQKIALSGNTGVSTGPHLHFEMRINGKAVDPLKYISY